MWKADPDVTCSTKCWVRAAKEKYIPHFFFFVSVQKKTAYDSFREVHFIVNSEKCFSSILFLRLPLGKCCSASIQKPFFSQIIHNFYISLNFTHLEIHIKL